MEVRELARVAWRRRWIVVVVLLATVASSTLFAFSLPEKFEATATIALTPDSEDGQGFIASDNLSALLGTYASTAESQSNLQRAEAELGRPLPGEVEASTEEGTGILRVTGRADTGQAAADTARAAAQAFTDSISTDALLVAQIVDPASVPAKPVQPRPPLIIAIALAIGLLLGLLLAYATDQLRTRIETSADIVGQTNAPVIGRIPRQRSLTRGDARVVWDSPKFLGVQEALRALRTNIQFLTGDDLTMLQVTSPTVAQGKSTVVANLGVALSQVGKEIVIVDGDLRRPRQHQIFGVDNSWGLSSLMARPGAEIQPVSTAYPGLSVIPSGPPPPDSTEMLHVAAASVLRDIRELDAFVLVDSPPILPVSDARLIAPQTDGVILVVAAGTQKPTALQSTLQKLELAEARLLGLVLNQAGDDEDHVGSYYYDYVHSGPGPAGLSPPR